MILLKDLVPSPSKAWRGDLPDTCQLCRRAFGLGHADTFIDGATRLGPWGYMCAVCHASQGLGLGIGLGQAFRLQPDGRWAQMIEVG